MTRPAALTEAQVREVLATLPGWTLASGSLTRTVIGSSFAQVIAWVVAIADAAEAADHHPDIDIRYSSLTLRLRTHEVDAITGRDVALARRIDAIVDQSKIGP